MSTTEYSIADLFAFVKAYDKVFSSKPVNKMLLNDDGMPKILYHGTRNSFTVFNTNRIGENYSGWSKYGYGFYFSETFEDVEHWAIMSLGLDDIKVMPVYLKMENPLVIDQGEFGNNEDVYE